MIESSLIGLIAVPAGLGLIGIVEPCSIGSSLVFVKHLEGKSAAAKLTETILFAAVRAVFIGLLGVIAVVIGSIFLDLQRSAWLLLGAVYIALGLLLVTGRARGLTITIGPSLRRLSDQGRSAGLVLVALGVWSISFGLLASIDPGAVAAT